MDSPPHGDSLYARGASEISDLTAWDSERSVLLLKLADGANPFQSCGAFTYPHVRRISSAGARAKIGALATRTTKWRRGSPT